MMRISRAKPIHKAEFTDAKTRMRSPVFECVKVKYLDSLDVHRDFE